MISKRSGFTLMEILVSCLLLAALLTLCVQLVGTSATQRKAAAMRETALLEAANALEGLVAGGWESLTPAAADQAALSQEAAASLPGGELAVEIEPVEEDPAARRIAVEVRWLPSPGRFPERVRLVAWKYGSTEQPQEDR